MDLERCWFSSEGGLTPLCSQPCKGQGRGSAAAGEKHRGTNKPCLGSSPHLNPPQWPQQQGQLNSEWGQKQLESGIFPNQLFLRSFIPGSSWGWLSGPLGNLWGTGEIQQAGRGQRHWLCSKAGDENRQAVTDLSVMPGKKTPGEINSWKKKIPKWAAGPVKWSVVSGTWQWGLCRGKELKEMKYKKELRSLRFRILYFPLI